MTHGLRNRAIAAALHKSEKTIEKQIAGLFAKLELRDVTLDRRVLAAVMLAVSVGASGYAPA